VASQENKLGVWRNGYAAVFHFGNGGSVSTLDSSGSGNNLTNSGVGAAAGEVGGAVSINYQYLYNMTPNGLPTGTAPRTVEAWFKQTSAQTGKWIAGYGSTEYFLIGAATLSTYGNWTGSAWQGVNSSGTSDTNWHWFASTLTAPGTWANVTNYLDGVALASTTQLSGSLTTTGDQLSIGRQNTYNGNYWSGLIDEVRISTLARSTDWIATEYANESSPSTFFFVCSDEVYETQPTPCGVPVPASTFAYNRPITISHLQVPNTDQADFPVLISGTFPFLATVANSGKVQNANGYDIVFTADAAGQSQLDHEIDSYDPGTGTAAFWVRIPVLPHTSDTTIYMWYGSSAVMGSQENAPGVWKNGYAAVYHFGNGSIVSTLDSSGSGNTLTNTGVGTCAGRVGGGVSTVNNQYLYNLSPNFLPTGSAPRTVQAWFKQTGASTGGWIAGYGSTPYFLIGATTVSTYGNWTGSTWQGVNSSGTSDTTNWHLFASTLTAPGAWANVTNYLDGVALGSTTQLSGSLTTTGDQLAIGRQNTANFNYWYGLIDEVRISTVARSADWLDTEYNNQNSPSTFAAVGGPSYFFIATSILPPATQYFSYSATVATSGGTAPYAWSIVSGALPTGFSIDASSGAIAGTSTSAGTYNFTMQAQDVNANVATRQMTIVVNPPPPVVIGTASLTAGVQNVAYNATLSASGGVPPYTWSVTSGALPTGLSLDPNAGTITGTPSATGLSTFTVQAQDSVSSTGTKALSIVVFIVSGLTPLQAAVGGTIVVNGAGFGTNPGIGRVNFNNLGASVTYWTDTAITVVVPSNAQSGFVTVTINGATSNGTPFALDGAPTITSLSPNIGMVGTPVNLKWQRIRFHSGHQHCVVQWGFSHRNQLERDSNHDDSAGRSDEWSSQRTSDGAHRSGAELHGDTGDTSSPTLWAMRPCTQPPVLAESSTSSARAGQDVPPARTARQCNWRTMAGVTSCRAPMRSDAQQPTRMIQMTIFCPNPCSSMRTRLPLPHTRTTISVRS
jgi:hypothetical protein